MRAEKGRSLGAAAIVGVAWTFGAQWGMRLLGLASTVVLARVLTPEDFGLVAIALAGYSIIEGVTTFQPQDYLIRVKQLEDWHRDTAFTLGLLRGILVAIVVAGAAFLLPSVSFDPRLHQVALAVAAMPLIAGFANPRAVEFQREMNFSFAAGRQLTTKLVGVIVTIAVALIWRTHWALILGLIAKEILWLPISYAVKPYRPRLSLAGWRGFLSFSIWATAESFVGSLGKQADRLLVAAAANVRMVGAFTISKEFSWIVGGELFGSLEKVLFPAFTKVNHEPERLRRAVIEAFSVLAAITLPWTIGGAIVGPQLILVLYGQQWHDAAALITPLMLILTFQAASSTARALALADGKPRLIALRNAIGVAVRLGAFAVALHYFDIRTAVYATLAATLINTVFNFGIIRDISGITAGELIAAARRSILSVVVMSATLLLSHDLFPDGMSFSALLVTLVGKTLLGAGVYAGCHLLLWHAAGRPHGAEVRLIAIFRTMLRIGP